MNYRTYSRNSLRTLRKLFLNNESRREVAPRFFRSILFSIDIRRGRGVCAETLRRYVKYGGYSSVVAIDRGAFTRVCARVAQQPANPALQDADAEFKRSRRRDNGRG